jgi:transcriptional regulator with XRE-family HTH domain
MTTIYDQRYIKLIEHLAQVRNNAGVTQNTLAEILGWDQSAVSKVERFDRRLDVMELYDWLTALNYNHRRFFEEIGFLQEAINTSIPAMPVPGKATQPIDARGRPIDGTLIEMAWQGSKREVLIQGLPVDGYLRLESEISTIYKSLNDGRGGKNREAILLALSTAIERFPNVNPSDLYHHIVYRLYLRDYTKTQADRSWVRAGGEAFELFLEKHYNQILNPVGIYVKWLYNDALKASALEEMGIDGEVGGSKLDIALYGEIAGRPVIFGGIHAKLSLAERVSDDVPCSVAMMQRGLASYLVTLDAKSFPPPNGDLVNRGELGTLGNPSDKRNYIEIHGSFTACFSYNLRTTPSGEMTFSGRRIYVSTFNRETDPLPHVALAAWNDCQVRRQQRR